MSEEIGPPSISHIYASPEGTEIRVVVPWQSHSGRIPPPTIEFHTERAALVFVYARTENG